MSLGARASRTENLGILYVQGFTTGKAGRTLASIVDPLLEWLQTWMGDPEAARLDPEYLDRSVQHQKRLILRLRVDAPPSGWVVRNSRWTEVVELPAMRDLLRWWLPLLPVVFLWCVVGRLPAHLRTVDATPSSRLRRAIRLVPLLLPTFFGLLVLPIVLLGFVLVSITAPLLRRICLIPNSEEFRELGERLELFVMQLLTTTHMMLASPTRTDAAVRTVRTELQDLETTCDSIAILATAEGAAIAHRVLKEYRPRRVVRLITIGSAQRRMELVHRCVESRGSVYGWLFIAGMIAYAVWESQFLPDMLRSIVDNMVLLSRYIRDSWNQISGMINDLAEGREVVTPVRDVLRPASGLTDFSLGLPGIGSPFLWSGLASMGVASGALRRRAIFDDDLRGDARRLRLRKMPADFRWIDYYSSHDLIANGPVTYPHVAWVTSREVANGRSILSDHRAYFVNMDEFLPSLVAELSDASHPIAGVITKRHTQALRDAKDRRRDRLRARRRARVILVSVLSACSMLALSVSSSWGHTLAGAGVVSAGSWLVLDATFKNRERSEVRGLTRRPPAE